MLFAVDTNILVYAHNTASPHYNKAKQFVEMLMNQRNKYGELNICLPTQVLTEFVHVITWQNLETPLSLQNAIQTVQDYLDAGVKIISQQDTQVQTFINLLNTVTTRKKVFDVALAATLKDNDISGLYTRNVDDFKEFDFLKIVNPLSDTMQ